MSSNCDVVPDLEGSCLEGTVVGAPLLSATRPCWRSSLFRSRQLAPWPPDTGKIAARMVACALEGLPALNFEVVAGAALASPHSERTCPLTNANYAKVAEFVEQRVGPAGWRRVAGSESGWPI
jgi:hypothetical protein